MKTRTTLVAAAVVLAFAQLPLTAAAQNAKPAAPAASPTATAAASTAKAPVLAKSPTDWIEYDDATYTPVLDDVSRALANARAALAKKDNAKAAEAMTTAARALRPRPTARAALTGSVQLPT